MVQSSEKWRKVGDNMSEAMLFHNFIGEFAHNIDKKGRIIIPAKFREAFGKELIVAKRLATCSEMVNGL